MAGKKWTPERLAKFRRTLRDKGRPMKAEPDVRIAIHHLSYIDKLIRNKPLSKITEVEHHAHLALRALTNK